MGILCRKNPYTSQSKTPVLKIAYMGRDKSRVCPVRITRTAWGKKDRVVKAAAAKPISEVVSISR